MNDDLIISKEELGRIEQINKGGTAIIYRLPDLEAGPLGVDAEGLVYKAYNARTRQDAGSALRPGLSSLVAFRQRRLSPAERLEWDREIAWPVRVVVDADEAVGIVMPLIPSRFHQSVVQRSGRLNLAPREVNMLFGDPGAMRRIGLDPALIEERMRLVRRAAAVYRRMHDHDVIAGDISARNLVYDIGGGDPAVLVIDADSARVASTRSAFSEQPHSPHWEPPEALAADVAYRASGGQVRLDALRAQSMRTDVYKFGLLVIRILDYGRQRSVNRDPGMALGVLRRRAGARAAEMLARSMLDRPADRPTMAQWCDALEAFGRAKRPRPRAVPTPGPGVTAAPRWCRSCGGGPRAWKNICVHCGQSLDAPDFGSARLGRLAIRGNRLLGRIVLAVAERGAEVWILDRGDEPVPMLAAEFDALPPVPIPASSVRSPAGRMWMADRVGRTLWSSSAADAAASAWATTSMGTRRAAAIDMITLSRSGPALLGEREMSWWRARAAALAGDVPALLEHLAALPGTGYDARADLLTLVFDRLCDDPGAVRDVLPPATSTARALLAALGPPDAPGVAIAAEEFIGNVAEAARLAFVSGDDARLAALPDENDAVRHFRAVRAYVISGELLDNDLRVDGREVLKRTRELSVGFAGVRPAYDAVAADPSTWSRLLRNAVAGRITADPALRERHPEFGSWLDLCALHEAAQRWDWAEILRSGPDVMLDATNAHIRTAALNVVAYATWQTGEAGKALRLLDRALAIRPTPGLLVNAALIAGDLPGLAAMPYLMRLGEHPGPRGHALRCALELWERHGGGGELPSDVVALLHAELAAFPDDDDLHHRLLTAALNHQSAWLAQRRVPRTGPSRPRRIAGWFHARAVMNHVLSRAVMTEAAIRMSALWHLTDRPDWADAELAWFRDRLDEVLVRGYQSPLNPVPAIEVLVNHRVIGPVESWTLLITAGATLVIGSAEEGERLNLDDEQRLVFDPVADFDRHRASLPPDAVKQLEESVSALVTFAAQAALDGAKRLAEQSRPQEETDWGWQLSRCRRYLAVSEVLPMGDVRTRLQNFVKHWAEE